MTAHRWRYLVLMAVVVGVFLGIVGRLVYLMVFQHDQYLDRSNQQIQKLIKIDTSRGTIFDRNMHPLAMSQPVDSVYASPARISDHHAFAQSVAPLVGMDPSALLPTIQSSATFVWLKRKIPSFNRTVLKAMNPNHVNVLQEEKRVYPNGSLASDILGFMGMDQGLGGVEYAFDRFLTGSHGYYVIQGDPRGVRIISSNKQLVGRAKGFSKGKRGVEASSLRGGHVVTTIDHRIQFLVEQLLKDAIQDVDATSGQAIVMDVQNGDILAMANYPFFDPNAFEDVPNVILKNSCVIDVFEPGSIFKLITYAAALEEAAVTPGTQVDVPEFITIARRRIKEAHPRLPDEPNQYSAMDIVVKSMNVGTVKLAQKMGLPAFYDYMHRFGFGQRTGIRLPGETQGLLRPLESATPIDHAVMSFGQGVSVTALQMVSAIAAIGNNGLYVRPRIIKHQTDHDQVTMSSPSYIQQRRVISSKTAQHVLEAMEDVVLRGTGRHARVPGYRVGGKTGTAQKPLENGRGYKKDAYIASFVGILPIQHPRYAILVLVDEPTTTIWGSTAAAPLFSQIARVLIDYHDIRPDL
tara:strand:- start:981 stop:2714 length:1734 start_codon:yes stop_codon:yes gene_type:complete